MDAWILARDILKKAGTALHYNEITDQILRSGVSGLEGKGGKTPEQTIGAVLRKHSDVFQRCGEGYYDLKNRPVILGVSRPPDRGGVR